MRKEQNKNQSNLGGKKQTKVKIYKVVPKLILPIIVVAILIATIFNALNKTPQDMKVDEYPELAKAMEYKQVQQGEEKVEGTDYIQFDAFFLRDLDGDGYAESIRGTCKEIGKSDTLYMELKALTNGYLEDGATITINNDRNFYFETAIVRDNEIKNDYIGINIGKIELNRIDNGTQKLLMGTVKSGDYRYNSTKTSAIGDNINKYSRQNTVTLKGIYVQENEEGETERIPIEKTVPLDVDWYGEVNCRITYVNGTSYTLPDSIDRENGHINLNFSISFEDTRKQLNLKKSEIQAEIPLLSEYEPEDVVITNNDIEYEYNRDTRILTAKSNATVRNEEIVTYYPTGSYTVRVTYPIEAYDALGVDTVQLKIPVQAKYEAYNNPNDEFKNPYISNIAKATVVVNYRDPIPQAGIVHSPDFDISVGKWVSHPYGRFMVSKEKPLKIYNGLSESEMDDLYIVRWYGYTGTNPGQVGMTFKDGRDTNNSDKFIKTNSDEDSMEDISKTVGIYFSNPESMLGEEGEIKVYDDETGMLLQTFTKNNWDKYSSSSPYKFEIGVKHIRVQTSTVKADTSLSIMLVKEIDDNAVLEKYTKDEFYELQYISSKLSGYLGERYITTDVHQAHYEIPLTEVKIEASHTAMSTQVTQENEIFTIQAKYYENNNEVKWVNGTFLLKLPKEIIDVDINSVEINNPSVDIISYEKYMETEKNEAGENEDYIFIKIVTSNETEEAFDITVNCNITPDPRIATVSKPVQLYAYNERGTEYSTNIEDKYDINNNLLTDDIIGITSVNLQLIAPQSLLTTQSTRDYDEYGNETLAPRIAEVSKLQKQATLDISVLNNYSGDITDVKILGKIPSTGNTYVINGKELGSTFDAKLKKGSINIPGDLKEYATIYYSYETQVTQDLTEDSNGWTQNPEEMDRVKSFLIDFGDCLLQRGNEYHITYEIELPEGLEYNQFSYAHHAVFFSLVTENGKYRTQIEPNKLGFRVAKKYDLEVTKYHKGTTKKVSGATYYIWEEGEQEGRTKVTNENGTFELKGLYVDKTYNIKEIISPEEYELNNEIIKFKTREENGVLIVESIEGTTKKLEATKEENKNYKVFLEVEDEVKANLAIIKIEKQNEEVNLKGTRFKITGEGLPENGRTLITNSEGKTNIKGLKIGKEYTLEEVKPTEGYYSANPIKFVVMHEEGTYKANIIEEQSETENFVSSNTTTVEDEIPTINFTIKNEKIPRYTLELTKLERVTESIIAEDEAVARNEMELADTQNKYIQGAKFKLYKGTKEIGTYETDNSGKITIENLYAYEEERNIDQTYTLKEIYAPDGYAKVKDIKFIVKKVEENIQFEELLQEGQTAKEYEIEGNIVKLIVEDSPSFKLIKKDKETNDIMKNVKFAIYNVDNGKTPAKNSKGEIIGTKEIIDGKEYYTISTDDKGELTADLVEGLYEAVEVEAPEQYDKSKTYYFGIGASKEGKENVGLEWARGLTAEIHSVQPTKDDGFIAGGCFKTESLNLGYSSKGQEVVFNNNGVATSSGSYSGDAILIKYNHNGIVEWAKSIGNSGDDIIKSLVQTNDEGYIVVGYFSNGNINLGNNVKGENVTLNNAGSTDGMIIKYNSDGIVEWAKSIGGTANDYIYSVSLTKSGVVLGGSFLSTSINLGQDINNGEATLDRIGSEDGMIIKYNSDGIVEWTKVIGGNKEDRINSVIETSDDGIAVGGYFGSTSINLGINIEEQDEILNNSGSNDGMIIKYDADGKVEWAKSIGGTSNDYISSVAETSDYGIVIGGYFDSKNIELGQDIKQNDVSIENQGGTDVILVKYTMDGKLEFVKTITGERNSKEQITSVIGSSDGGIIVGGYYESTINLGQDINGKDVKHNASKSVIWTTCNKCGIIIKYNTEGLIEWSRAISATGSIDVNIYTVKEVSDGVIVGGAYNGSYDGYSSYLGEDANNQKIILSAGKNRGMIVKYSTPLIQIPQITVEQVKSFDGKISISSIAETNDGGYIATGSFSDSRVNLGNDINGNEVILNKKETRDYTDGIIIKYNAEGVIEWTKVLGTEGDDSITKVIQTKDNGIVVVGRFQNININVGNDEDGNEVILNKKKNNTIGMDNMLIKYRENGTVEWANVIASSGRDTISYNNGEQNKLLSIAETKDYGIVVVGRLGNTKTDLGQDINGNKVVLASKGSMDGIIIKYNKDGELEWALSIGDDEEEQIVSVAVMEDGGIVVGGWFESGTINVGKNIKGENVVIQNTDIPSTYYEYADVLVVKYSNEGIVEWASTMNSGIKQNDEISSVTATSDGGVAMTIRDVYGSYRLNISDEINGNKSILGDGGSGSDGALIKFNANGVYEWAKRIGGYSHDYVISSYSTNNSIVICGYGSADEIELETDRNGEYVIFENNGDDDGFIIKYDLQGSLEMAENIGGENRDTISSVIETSNRELVVLRNF